MHHLLRLRAPPAPGLQIRLRLTPEIRFVRDDSIERSERILKLLDQVPAGVWGGGAAGVPRPGWLAGWGQVGVCTGDARAATAPACPDLPCRRRLPVRAAGEED